MSDYKLDTILAHAGINTDEKTGALIAPIYLSTTYQHPEFGQSTGFDYTRTKNPTRLTLEKTLAKIEKADYALVTSSGMAALVLLFNSFPEQSNIVAARDLYGGSFRWFNEQEKKGRYFFTYTNTEEDMLAAISEDTDYVFIETPTGSAAPSGSAQSRWLAPSRSASQPLTFHIYEGKNSPFSISCWRSAGEMASAAAISLSNAGRSRPAPWALAKAMP